jgi:signal peptidase II
VTETSGQSSGPSRRSVRWPLFVALAAVVVALDQVTKAWVVGRLAPGESLAVAGDLLRIVHGRNTGALFGLFRDQAPLFALFSIGVVVLIVAYQAHAGRSLLVTLALGLLLGGALGNLLDRVRLGYVVDFVDAGIGAVRWYTFNIADAAVSGAILLLILLAVRGDPAGERDDASARQSAGADPDPGTAGGRP